MSLNIEFKEDQILIDGRDVSGKLAIERIKKLSTEVTWKSGKQECTSSSVQESENTKCQLEKIIWMDGRHLNI